MNVTRTTLVALFALSVPAFAQFSVGNLAVLRVGDGVQTLTSFGNSVFIDQYTVAGGFVNSVTVPSSGAGSVVLGGNRTAEGWLAFSADHQFLTFAGYNSLPGAVDIQAASAATVPRVVGMVDMSGTFSMPISSTTAYSSQSFRSAATDGSGNYWGFGGGSAAAAN